MPLPTKNPYAARRPPKAPVPGLPVKPPVPGRAPMSTGPKPGAPQGAPGALPAKAPGGRPPPVSGTQAPPVDPKRAAIDRAKAEAKENTQAMLENGQVPWQEVADAGRRAHIDAAKAESKAKLEQAQAQGLARNPETGLWGDPDDLTDLARLQWEQNQERAAREDELRAEKARALQSATARADFGGMGLSGATAALQSNVGKTQERGITLALADLAKSQRDETRFAEQHDADMDWQELQWQFALRDLEEQDDVDHNDDGLIGGEKVGGKIGDGDPENNPQPEKTPEQKDDELDALLNQLDGNGDDFSPEQATYEQAKEIKELGVDFNEDDARIETSSGGGAWLIVKGDDGNLYKIAIDAEDLPAPKWGDDPLGYAQGKRALRALGLA